MFCIKLSLILDFQKFMINSLTKMKYELSGINSTTNATHILLNSFLSDSGNSIVQNLLNNKIEQTSDYYNLFPIQTEEDLHTVEDRLLNDKHLRSNLVCIYYIENN